LVLFSGPINIAAINQMNPDECTDRVHEKTNYKSAISVDKISN
jgi:hypothetical protein